MKEKSAYEELQEIRQTKQVKGAIARDGIHWEAAVFQLDIPDYVWDLINSFAEEREREAHEATKEITLRLDAIYWEGEFKSWQSHNRKRL